MSTSTLKILKARIIILGFCVFLTLMLLEMPAYGHGYSGDFKVISSHDNYTDSAVIYLSYFRSRIEQFLQFKLDTVVTVYIAQTNDEFYTILGNSFPDWGAGAALSEKSMIVIKSPAIQGVGKSLRELLGHELAHVMLHRASNGRWLPRWLHEGFSMFIAGEWRMGQDILVARATWTGNLIELQRLEGLNAFKGAQANLAYTESYLAVSSLLSKRDPLLLADFLNSYRNSNDFFRSWNLITGRNYNTWMTDWFNVTARKYRFFLFIFDSEIFWIIISLLFILLFIMKRIQNARTKKRWKIEERLRPDDDSYKKYFDGYYDEENKT